MSDDLYGFADSANQYRTEQDDLPPPSTAMKIPGQSGWPGGVGGVGAVSNVPGTSQRLQTAFANQQNRPTTASQSNRGAGYFDPTKHKQGGQPWDPLGQGRGPAPPLAKRSDSGPEWKAKAMDLEVNVLVEESAVALRRGDKTIALEKAKQAAKKERLLTKHREKSNMKDQINFDLTYAVYFNLAHCYEQSEMFQDALNTYSIVVRNKDYAQGGRLRVNMGNIYYKQRKFPAAIRMYRMAMDEVGATCKHLRFKMMRNIANAFVKLGQFTDAVQSLESIMDACPDAVSGYNLVICYYALGDKEKMKKGFLQLLSCPLIGGQDDLSADSDEAEETTKSDEATASEATPDALLLAAMAAAKAKDDPYLNFIKKMRKVVSDKIVNAAQLIASAIGENPDDRDGNFDASGFDWIIEKLRSPPDAFGADTEGDSAPSAMFARIAAEVQIGKGIAFLKRKHFDQAIEVFKDFEKNSDELLDRAATNLAFVYFLEGDIDNAEKYAKLSVKADRYNAKALVNRANCLYVQGHAEEAKEMFLEAIGVEADCTEAIFNLGLVCKQMGHLQDALQAFRKLHRLLPKSPQVMYHIANLFEQLGDHQQALEWFKVLQAQVPTDPQVLARLGTIYRKEKDDVQAHHNYLDSYKYFPANMDIISWLGVWYVNQELYEEAIKFFERAAEVEPHEVKWQLMVASCYRRMQSFHEATRIYKKIHHDDPENIECLQYLVTICKEINDKSYEEYAKKLRKLRRKAESQAQTGFIQNEVPQGLDQAPPQQQHQPQFDNEGSLDLGGVPSAVPQVGQNLRDGTDVKQLSEDRNSKQRQFNPSQTDEDPFGDDDIDDLLPS